MTASTRLRRGLLWLSRFSILSVIGLLCLEVALRSWLISPSPVRVDETYGTRYRPNVRVVQSDEGYSLQRTDDIGHLDQQLDRDSEHRVLLLGDSYSVAQQVHYGNRFSEVVERELPSVEVVNAAFGGWYPPYYLSYLRQHDPSTYGAVVVQLNDGDLLEFDRPDRIRYARNEQGSWELEQSPFPLKLHGPVAVVRGLRQRSALLTVLQRRIELLLSTETKRLRAKLSPTDVVPEENVGVASLNDRLVSLLRDIRDEHPAVVFVYIPQIDYHADPTGAVWPENGELYRSAAQRAGVDLIDTTPLLVEAFAKGGQPLHGFHNSEMGGGHLNRRGHEVVGTAIAQKLEKVFP